MNCDDLPGDTWRYRLDTIKTALVSECLAAKIPNDCEVYEIFSDLLPAAVEHGGGELEWGKVKARPHS